LFLYYAIYSLRLTTVVNDITVCQRFSTHCSPVVLVGLI